MSDMKNFFDLLRRSKNEYGEVSFVDLDKIVENIEGDYTFLMVEFMGFNLFLCNHQIEGIFYTRIQTDDKGDWYIEVDKFGVMKLHMYEKIQKVLEETKRSIATYLGKRSRFSALKGVLLKCNQWGSPSGRFYSDKLDSSEDELRELGNYYLVEIRSNYKLYVFDLGNEGLYAAPVGNDEGAEFSTIGEIELLKEFYLEEEVKWYINGLSYGSELIKNDKYEMSSALVKIYDIN